MKYCNRCVLPDTRPGIVIDERGVCSACRGHEDKESRIDWAARAQAFAGFVAEAKQRAGTGYHCVVPASGGKDSWYQIVRAQEFGLKVLAVTWKTPGRTAIGQRNLDAMVRELNVDHIDYTIAPDVERRFMVAAFEHKGATAIPMHMAIFSIPLRLAVGLRIPLVVWGENSQLEYGGPDATRLSTDLDLAWIRRYGVNNDTELRHWIGQERLTEEDLAAYRLPSQSDIASYPVRSVFLGSFFKWNSFDNAAVAASRGFVAEPSHRKTGLWNFADIDCDFISLHHFLKWYKFGIIRAFDNLSVQIRYGQIRREDAIKMLKEHGLEAPREDVTRFCSFVNKSERWFWSTAERFRNKDIWYRDGATWKIRDFLIPNWDWSSDIEVPCEV